MHELPTITTANYVSPTVGGIVPLSNTAESPAWIQQTGHKTFNADQLMARDFMSLASKTTIAESDYEDEEMSEDGRRLVRVLIADPCEDVPTEDALLYDSKEIFTDKTDQELFFDCSIAEILKKHNEKRVQIPDSEYTDNEVMLKAARIRDLKMIVLTLASL